VIYASKKEELKKTVELLKILCRVERVKFSPQKAFQYLVCSAFLFVSLQHLPEQYKVEAWTINAIMPKLRLISEKKIEQRKQ